MDHCWYKVFLDAYTYSSTYLLLVLTVLIASILCLWIYEKPGFYKLIFKKSKQSNTLSPVCSEEIKEDNYNKFVSEHETSHLSTQKEDMKLEEFVKT